MKKTISLYNGEITVHFDSDSKNRYVIEQTGKSPIGVTSVLGKTLAKDGLMLWAMYEALTYIKAKADRWESPDDPNDVSYEITPVVLEEAATAHTKKSDKGKDVGSQVHHAIEKFLGGDSVDITNDIRKPLKAFVGWFNDVQPIVEGAERIIYSREHDYAGTFDALMRIDGKLVLCDVKTTNASKTAPKGIYPEYFIQLGAYSLAHHEEGGERVKDLMVINCNKQGVLSTCRASELGLSVLDCERAWKACLKLYRFLAPLSKQLGEL